MTTLSSFFKRYSPSLFGLTGTLGNSSTRNFLQSIYDVDMVVIPLYQSQETAFNEHIPYRCKELVSIIAPTKLDWYKSICDTIASKVRHGRPVLIICKSIKQVRYLKSRLLKKLGGDYQDKIFTYTGASEETQPASNVETQTSDLPTSLLLSSFRNQKAKFTKRNIDLGEILIATNIAGRGTDIITSDAVEAVGGMHVCITFLPESYRVEIQNAGRTARQGKKGSTQLVLHDPCKISIDAQPSRSDRNCSCKARCSIILYSR